MSFISRPNSWVAQEATSTTQLTYALQVNPAPITVSLPDQDPVLASLEFVLTNPTSTALAVQSVAFTLVVGDGASLTPTTAGITTAVSDPTSWTVVGPASPVTSGTATYTLGPVTGSDVSLDAGASVVVQLFQIQTNTTPGNTIIEIKEIVAAKPGFTNFQVTTFPTGFFFTGLIPTVQSGSALVPVAQINTGATVTLVWNSSVVDTAAFTIYYSNAEQGQQTAKPSNVGEWTTGPLTSDTVFTAVVQVSVTGGQPLTAALMTSVSVQNPSLVAASISAGRATVSGAASVGGPLTANAITATGLTVNGQLSANSATINGALAAGGATINGTLAAGSANFSGAVQAFTLNATTAAITKGFRANQSSVALFSGRQALMPGAGVNVWKVYQAHTDGFVIGFVGHPSSPEDSSIAWATGYTNGIQVQAMGGNVAYIADFKIIKIEAMCFNPNMFILPVQTGNQFGINIQQNTFGVQTNAPYDFYWIPLGTGQAAQLLNEDEIWDHPPVLPDFSAQPVRQDDEPRQEFVTLLEQVIGKPIDNETKVKLISVLRRI
ncbi:MAG: hypothetical protein JOZ51_06700 [Chloroflexi bacterium]|nr:hypothetical protein [Chloroflexota bacterium]